MPSGSPWPPLPAALPGHEALADRIGVALRQHPARQIPGAGQRSAVLLLLYSRDDEPHVVLTKRTNQVAHPGQVSLPGGRFEAGDLTLKRTALRETEEEIGVSASLPRVVGRLDDVETMVSGFVISPFVGALSGPFRAVPDQHEVARVMEIKVAEVLSRDAELPPAAGIADLRYPLDSEDVWGATARILRLFSEAARRALAPGAR